jgi:hypothetical protein
MKTKKPQKPLPKLNLDALKGFGGGLRDILVAASTHPATAGLAVMGFCGALQFLTGAYNEEARRKSVQKDQIHKMLNNIYGGAQGLATTCAVVPVAVGAVNLAADVAKRYQKPG